jgi:hypothetical protein
MNHGEASVFPCDVKVFMENENTAQAFKMNHGEASVFPCDVKVFMEKVFKG